MLKNFIKARIFHFSYWIKEIDPYYLKNKITELLSESRFEILGFQDHYFQPHGYTGLWLLGESHFALHTFPEEGVAYIELSSCNREYFDSLQRMIPENFKIEDRPDEV